MREALGIEGLADAITANRPAGVRKTGSMLAAVRGLNGSMTGSM